MHVHFVGVSGTGMGALAMLFRESGARVTGSDVAFDPPIGPALAAAGIARLQGYSPANLEPAPDLVVVGNAIRKDNVEARAAEERGLARASMSAALRDHFLKGRRPLVVAGTHGKTTTSAMCAWLLHSAGQAPGYFIGGLPKNLPSGAAIGRVARSLVGAGAGKPSAFVVEGDEYDAVYWHKKPKLGDYLGVGDDDVCILTSVEHDHVDVYPTEASYEAAFAESLAKLPPGGRLVVDASQARAVAIARENAACATSHYAVDGDDTRGVLPEWLAMMGPVDEQGRQSFDVFVGGASCGRFVSNVPGKHNVRNALAAIAVGAECFGVTMAQAKAAFASFDGVRRRQDLLGEPRGVRVYDDFAHHPTAVDETLRALRGKHPGGKLFAVFEPRSATACRNLHQEAYTTAFDVADRVVLAPLGRSNVPEGERLDTTKLALALGEKKAVAAADVDAIVGLIDAEARPGDTVALLSNGTFAGLHNRLIEALSKPTS